MIKKSQDILKAYFDTGGAIDESFVVEIISILNRQGCNVMQSVVGTDLEYTLSSKKGANNFFNNKLKEIADSDIVVFEMNKVSSMIMSLIYESIKLKKPTLVLTEKENSNTLDKIFEDNTNSILITRLYDKDELESIIQSFVETARVKVLNSRFTVRLNTQLNEYLELLKMKWGLSSKNDVIIRLLEEKYHSE